MLKIQWGDNTFKTSFLATLDKAEKNKTDGGQTNTFE